MPKNLFDRTMSSLLEGTKDDFFKSVSTEEEEVKEVKYTRIFEEYVRANSPVIIHRGGARSSKSYSICQKLCLDWIENPNAGLKILIVRKTLPSIRTSVLVTFKDVVNSLGVSDHIEVEKKELNFWYGKNLIHFSGLDDVDKLKSSEWNIIWMEEATDFGYADFQQLQLRLSAKPVKHVHNHLVLSFNPIDGRHWIKTVLMETELDYVEIVSTYKDNPFLSLEYVKLIEDLILKDENFARIYAEGEWGILENVIYKNWDVVPYFPDDLEVFFGLDFGFNAPTALIQVGKGSSRREFWEKELFYETGKTTDQLIEKLPYLLGRHVHCPIYCDSASPEKIEKIKKAGFNAKKAKKGKSSVKFGIDYIKACTIHLIKGSDNLTAEKRIYSWIKRKDVVLDEPIDYDDHLMDAERYAIMTHLSRGGARVRWLDI